MEILSKRSFYRRKEEMIKEMLGGKIFVYPTDTIYGIGCNALVKESVRMVRKIKRRQAKPFSVIAPSVEWIEQNCLVDEDARKWLAKLPGKLTLVLPIKNKGAVSGEVNKNSHGLGVRIPRNWFAGIVSEAGIPFVTTSVNLADERFMTSLKDINEEVKGRVDYIIDQGPLDRKPSRVISLIAGQKILR